jgi:hypothetical protein
LKKIFFTFLAVFIAALTWSVLTQRNDNKTESSFSPSELSPNKNIQLIDKQKIDPLAVKLCDDLKKSWKDKDAFLSRISLDQNWEKKLLWKTMHYQLSSGSVVIKKQNLNHEIQYFKEDEDGFPFPVKWKPDEHAKKSQEIELQIKNAKTIFEEHAQELKKNGASVFLVKNSDGIQTLNYKTKLFYLSCEDENCTCEAY